MSNIKEKIGMCALLEQTAEECTELAQACLKLSRKYRGENPTPATIYDLQNKVTEEFADVRVCMLEMLLGKIVIDEEIDVIVGTKTDRWEKRIEEHLKTKKNNI